MCKIVWSYGFWYVFIKNNMKTIINCLKCTHFLREVTYRCNGSGYVLSATQTMECTKTDTTIHPQDVHCFKTNAAIGPYFSEQMSVSAKTHYIKNKCIGGYDFLEIPEPGCKVHV